MQTALSSSLQGESEPDAALSPIASGSLMLVIGGVLIFLGIRGWRRGLTKDKFGIEYTGGKAKLMSAARIGVGALIFGAGVVRLLMT